MKRIGYAQVEPNHLSARYTGQIYAQLPAKDSNGKAITQLENGQFLKYDYAAGCASNNGDSAGEWMLVFNEEKLYDERYQNHKDFAMLAKDFTDETIYPRLLKTNVGDIFTTNAFKSTTATSDKPSVAGPNEPITMEDLSIGDLIVVGDDGWLKKSTAASADSLNAPVFKVVPHFTQIKDDGSIDPAYETKTIGSKSVIVYNYTLPDMQDAVKLQRVK